MNLQDKLDEVFGNNIANKKYRDIIREMHGRGLYYAFNAFYQYKSYDVIDIYEALEKFTKHYPIFVEGNVPSRQGSVGRLEIHFDELASRAKQIKKGGLLMRVIRSDPYMKIFDENLPCNIVFDDRTDRTIKMEIINLKIDTSNSIHAFHWDLNFDKDQTKYVFNRTSKKQKEEKIEEFELFDMFGERIKAGDIIFGALSQVNSRRGHLTMATVNEISKSGHLKITTSPINEGEVARSYLLQKEFLKLVIRVNDMKDLKNKLMLKRLKKK